MNPNFLISIGSLMFLFKVVVQVAFQKNGLLLELFYLPLVDYMYVLMCKAFVWPTICIILGFGTIYKNVTKHGQRLH